MGEFATDKYGIAIKCQDIKLSTGLATWKTRMRQVEKTKGLITIVTYSLPCIETVKEILGKRTKGVTIIANQKFIKQAQIIKREFPNIRIMLRPDVHSKELLVYPDTVHISSANFGISGWYETTVSMHSKKAYNHFIKDFNDFLVGADIE